MTFEDINFELDYVLNPNEKKEFYTRLLANSKTYFKIQDYFNLDALYDMGAGFCNLIKNEGNVKLLFGLDFDRETLSNDFNFKDLEYLINKKLKSTFVNAKINDNEDILELLSWMFRNNFIDFKVGLKIDKGTFMGGFLHPNLGIAFDSNYNYISFNGLNPASDYEESINNFKIFNSLDESKIYADYDLNLFNCLWDNNNENLYVMDLSDEIKEDLLEYSKYTNIEDLFLKFLPNEKDLYPHQIEAIDSWFDNDKRGILEMATGTGKTLTALKCLERLLLEEDVVTVVSCPYSHLIDQWASEIEDLNLAEVYKFYSSGNTNWRLDFENLNFNIKWDIIKRPVIILTTHNTFSSKDFIDKINKVQKNLLLIADEMHHLAAKTFSNGLIEKYTYRLGLSATPSHFMDPEGTDLLLDYFNDIVFTFNLAEALTTNIPGTDEKFLTPYDYYPQKVDLNAEELDEYYKLSKKIGQILANPEHDKDIVSKLMFKRRAIVNNAISKYDYLRDILRNLERADHLIIYCSDKQIDNVLKILDEEDISPSHRFTSKEKIRKSNKFAGLSEREYLLKEFDKGNYKALVAMKCLDEGVDVPSADKVIIMSSTTNPIEYIQRRGRVLRKYKNKQKAQIYDLIVLPEQNDETFDKIIKNEVDRLIDFIKTANNMSYCAELLKKWECI